MQLDKYADLLLEVGVNLQPGQCLALRGEPCHWELFNLLAEKAYQRGARYVDVRSKHAALTKARIDHADEKTLDYVPPHVKTWFDTMVEEKWAVISITGPEDPEIHEDLDPDRNRIATQALREVRKPFSRAIGAARIPWVVASMPTAGWAAKILNEPATEESRQRLWEILVPILRLDREDPVATWWELAEALQRRAGKLNGWSLEELHFEAPGTDLTIGLSPHSSWMCGGCATPEGQRFVPNLPTEEVFTTPDFRKTRGRVQVTRPVRLMGKRVRGAWFVFEEGCVTDFGADSGQETLERFMDLDDGARRVGEVALVDCTSPIFRSGHLFDSILLDENATCHLALGRGLGIAWDGDNNGSDEELEAEGFNPSLAHTDFMIGSQELDVVGVTASGERRPIIQGGEFVEALQ